MVTGSAEAANSASPVDPADARQIMAAALDPARGRTTFMKASFELFAKDGTTTRKSFTVRLLDAPGGRRTLVVFTAPEEVRGMALLSVADKGIAERQYIYVPSLHRVRNVATQQRASRFLGTDFSFEDVTPHEADDFSYELRGDGPPLEGHKTTLIVAKPVDATRSQYGRLEYAVAKDLPVILRTEMYDPQGQLVRVLDAHDIRRISGVSGARRTEVRTVADGTRTVLSIAELRLDLPLDEKDFTPEALEAAAPGAAAP
jgi:hypothetical protein